AGGAGGPDPHRDPADLARGPAVLGALWGLVWDGRVGNDTFAPVRGLLSLGKTAHRTGRQTPRARTARTGGAAGAAAGRGLGGRLAGVRGRGRYAGLTSPEGGARGSAGLTAGTVGLSAAEQARSAGRWSLLPAAEQDPTIRAHATAELLLDRYGVITRGSVVAEEVPGGFAGQYRLLTRMEDAGQVRRGHFVDGLGGAQFSTGAVVDRLRGFQRDEEDAAVDTAPLALTLAATDPANPYGAALDWPSVPAGPDGVVPTGHRPGRKAGAVVVLIAGRLALYMERGGRTLLAFTEDPGELRAAAEALVWALRTGRTERLSLEKVNGGPVLGTPLAEALLAAGFYSSPSGIRFRN
ncbi:Lhr family helicase, partial [Micrococcus luteus]|uniref:Lhr family helicase n=1 Tax=Micrococcus luteus TaxID=1270 RepID=UPI001EBFDA8B|nr:ATP-dependent helicase [Micrococcus luteus]